MIPTPSHIAAPRAGAKLSPRFRARRLLSLPASQIRIDLHWCELHFSAPHAARVSRLLAHCDGSRDLLQLAGELGWSPEHTADLVSALYGHGVLLDQGDQPAPAQLCQQHLVAHGRTLRARMSAQSDLLGAEPHRRQLLGSLVETYHFVAAASEHIGAALAQAPGDTLRQGLSRLFADEWLHGNDLRQGLLRAGISQQELQECQPLPQTRCVIQFLRTLAATDLLSYGICAAINESPKSDRAIKETWERIGRLGLLPAEAIAPFRGHELEDEASDHQNLSALLFCERSTISAVEQQRIRAQVSAFIELQRQCYQALRHYYQEPQGAPWFKGAAW